MPRGETIPPITGSCTSAGVGVGLGKSEVQGAGRGLSGGSLVTEAGSGFSDEV